MLWWQIRLCLLHFDEFIHAFQLCATVATLYLCLLNKLGNYIKMTLTGRYILSTQLLRDDYAENVL